MVRRPWWLALFCAYVAGTVAQIGYVVAREPFAFDAWNVAADTHAQPITLARFFAYWRFEYAHGNPRLGQPLAYLAYKVGGFAEIATPLAFVALAVAIATLGLGRIPRRGRDLALLSIVIGFSWFALPQLGRTMFARAYATNYIYGAAIQLWFLVPLRLAGATRPTRDGWIAYALAGVLAGMCNEHTGVALVLFLAGYAWWSHRMHGTFARPLAGAIGALVGFVALLAAPGQHERYNGLADRASLVGRVVDRGVGGALDILVADLRFAAPLLAILVVVMVIFRPSSPRSSNTLVALALGAGLVIAATLCASPKQGSRFFILPQALLLAAVIATIDTHITSARALAIVVGVAAAISIYAAIATVPLAARQGAAGEARIAALVAAPRGEPFYAEPYPQVAETWWFIGDDFRDPNKRHMIAHYFGFASVTLRR